MMIKNTFYAMLAKAVALIGYMGLDIYIARMLNVNGYAEWAFFYSIANMLFCIGGLGINSSSKVFISKQDSFEGKKKSYTIAFKLRLVCSVSVAAIFILIAYFIRNLYTFSDKYPNMDDMLMLGGGMFLFFSIAEFYKETSIGLEKYQALFWYTFFEYAGYIIGVIICLSVYANPVSVPIGYIIGGIIVFIAGICLGKKELFIKEADTKKAKATAQKIMRYALPIALMGMGGAILLEMDVFMLGVMSTKEQLSVYSIAKQWCNKAIHVNQILITGVMTSFAILNSENIVEKYEKFKKVSLLNTIVTVSVMLAMIFILPYVLLWLYGEEYKEVIPVLKMLTFYYGLFGISTFYATFLDFQNKAKVRSIYYASIIVINLILNFLLIPKYGAMGATIATIVSLIPYTICVCVESIKCFKSYMKK